MDGFYGRGIDSLPLFSLCIFPFCFNDTEKPVFAVKPLSRISTPSFFFKKDPLPVGLNFCFVVLLFHLSEIQQQGDVIPVGESESLPIKGPP